jgi:hypothetical protein
VNKVETSTSYAEISTFEVGEEDGRVVVTAVGTSRGGESRAIDDDRLLVPNKGDLPLRYRVLWSKSETGAWLIWARAFEVESP